jgi:hypothetical protein
MQAIRRMWLAAFLCAAGLLAGVTTARAVDPKLLPSGTEAVVTINLGQILKSTIAKFFLDNGMKDKGLDKYFKKAGFNLYTDLDSVSIASDGTQNPEAVLLIVEGKFDAAKIEESVVAAGKDANQEVKVSSIGGAKVFEIAPPDEKKVYIGIVNKGTILATVNKEGLSDAIARFNGTKSSTMKKEVKSLFDTTNSKQSLSFVVTGKSLGEMLKNAPNVPEKALDEMKKVDGLSAAITLDKNVTFQLGVNAVDADVAKTMAEQGNAGLKLAMFFVNNKAQQDEKFAPAVDVMKTLRVSSQGVNVVLRGEITYETLGKVLKNIPMP